MKASSASVIALAAALQATLAAAQTSLFIPGFDPQAITADIEGVDAQGRTTYRIGPGATSGTFDDPAGIVGSATLVADATEAHLVWDYPAGSISMSEGCVIATDGVAVCSAVVSAEGTLQSAIVTETVAPFLVQGGSGTAVPTAASGASASDAAPTSGPGATAKPSNSRPTGTGSSASATATNGTDSKNNGVGRVESSVALSLGVVGLVSVFFL
ncbi:hypothetical protein C8Q78DRAFT_1021536 [Trametes maxima]|nr:hypothetical protein C8Q78DRAFT_1021536 [Trametes maxima]